MASHLSSFSSIQILPLHKPLSQVETDRSADRNSSPTGLRSLDFLLTLAVVVVTMVDGDYVDNINKKEEERTMQIMLTNK